ncbi:MAG: tetratricopeptide repeat protein [Alistipes sp.]|nr:tetratricopeptide repeat protein [Alistipes sp.]
MERIIEERPDSVLNVLQTIDTDNLIGDEERAKHAVLLSMALDKNVIDMTDFEVLQPAIDYYEDNGTATDKLRTYFYQGRIYQNAGNDALAMECFVKAIADGDESEDTLTKANIYFAKGKIYYSLYEWNNAIEAFKTAASYYKQTKRYYSYVNCLILVINCYTLNNNLSDAFPYIEECKQYKETMGFPSLSNFYASYIIYLGDGGTDDEIQDAINEYLDTIPEENIDWLTLANAYIELGQYEEALQAIEQYRNGTDKSLEKKYKALKSEIYEKLGRYEESLRAYKEYMIVSDSTTWAIMQQDTKFVEERHSLELQTLKERESKTRVILWSALVIAILLSIIVFIRYRLKVNRMEKTIAEQETEKYRLLYLQIEEERDNLTNLLAQSEEFAPEIKTAVVKRLELLNKFFTAFITNNSDIDRTASKEMEELLANKDTFMVSTKLAFAGSHPKFIKYLEEHNLSEQEIEICCLYAIGLKGKDIKAYTSQPRHYNQSADIRHKLGLTESDTNLSIFLRDMLEK